MWVGNGAKLALLSQLEGDHTKEGDLGHQTRLM